MGQKGGRHLASNITEVNFGKISFAQRAKIGLVGGLVGGFAIFLIIFAIDAQLGFVPGTFYKVVGIPVGLEDNLATMFGLVAHLTTAGLIGAVFFFCSGLHKNLEINSLKKGALAGAVSSLAVFVLFFLPITMLVINPILESSTTDTAGIISSTTNIDSIKLLQNMELILIGGLEIHIVFGLIMGVFCTMIKKMHMDTQHQAQTNKFLKSVLIGIILATGVIGAYYTISPSVNITVGESKLHSSLNEIQEGLTFDKFTKLDEVQQMDLVSQMSSETILAILEESKKTQTYINEDMSPIISAAETFDEIKRQNIAQFKGLKGNFVTGNAVIITTNDNTFLRFEDFAVTNGPSLHVFMTKSGDVKNGIDVGLLKANNGNQNYDITGVDTKQYSVIVIYSSVFERYYASANLPLKNL